MVLPSFGTEYAFSAENVYYIHVTVLDATHFVVVYKESSTGDGVCIVGEISGGVISYGTPATFYSGTIDQTEIAVLDSTHFVVSHWGNNVSRSMVGTVTGTTIAYGTPVAFNPSNSGDLACVVLDSTHFVVAYKDWGDGMRGKVVAGTVSGTTITFGGEYVTTLSTGNYNALAALDSTRFVVAYNNNVRVGTVTGTSISLGTASTFHTGGTAYNKITALDSTHFVVAFRDTTLFTGTAVVGLVSGTTISSYGSEGTFNDADVSDICIMSCDEKCFAVGYKDVGNSDYGTFRSGHVLGTVINSWGGEAVFNSAGTNHIDLALITNPSFVLAYQDVGNSDYGTALCGSSPFFVPQINIM